MRGPGGSKKGAKIKRKKQLSIAPRIVEERLPAPHLAPSSEVIARRQDEEVSGFPQVDSIPIRAAASSKLEKDSSKPEIGFMDQSQPESNPTQPGINSERTLSLPPEIIPTAGVSPSYTGHIHPRQKKEDNKSKGGVSVKPLGKEAGNLLLLIACLIEGSDICGAACFDGENLWLATNSPSVTEVTKAVIVYLRAINNIGKELASPEKIEEAVNELNTTVERVLSQTLDTFVYTRSAMLADLNSHAIE